MLGLSADKNMVHAAILSDGGDVVSDYKTDTPADSYRNYLLAVSKAVKQDLQASFGREIVIRGYGTCFNVFEALYGAGR